jgi:primase-polymerase (primpol)-like protein
MTKMPTQMDGKPASSTDSTTWTSYARVRGADRKGFALNGDGIVCLDLDHCLDGDTLADWAARLLSTLPKTYIERSVSGTGLHVFGRGHVPAGRKIRDHRAIEIYGTGRYIAVTGDRFTGSSLLADLSEVIAALT